MKNLNIIDYLKQLPDDMVYNENASIRKEALKIALESRKFEIDLYWKRANYFWTFNTVIFAGYFAIMSSQKIENFKFITIIISLLGYFISLGWYFANRGSKYWQINWETHVDVLGKDFHGEIFKYIKNSNKKFWKFSQEYPFSVSKINQNISIITTICWLFLIFYSFWFTVDKHIGILNYLKENSIWFFILIISVIYFGTYIFAENSKSFILNKNKNSDEEINFDYKK